MRRILLHVGLVVATATTTLIGGCAGNNNHAAHGRHADVSGMMCPKCETVWVGPHTSAASGSRVQALHWGREMVCPDCDAMAKAYFQDGKKVLHDCPTCKVAPRPATPVKTTPTHPKGTHT